MSSHLMGKKVSIALTDDHIADAFCAAIEGPAAKDVARRAGVSDGAVKKWRQRKALPGIVAVINLMRADDAVFNTIVELAGRAPVGVTEDQRAAAAALLRLFEGQECSRG